MGDDGDWKLGGEMVVFVVVGLYGGRRPFRPAPRKDWFLFELFFWGLVSDFLS